MGSFVSAERVDEAFVFRCSVGNGVVVHVGVWRAHFGLLVLIFALSRVILEVGVARVFVSCIAFV